MKNFVTLFLAFLLVGCSAINVPNYIQDEYPYKQKFFAGYDEVLASVRDSLSDLNWVISKESDPTVYERSKVLDMESAQQILLFTQPRRSKVSLGTSYTMINIYVETGSESSTDVEVRFASITPTPVKSFYDYRNDNLIRKLFEHIQKNLDT